MRYAKVINGLQHNDTLCSYVPGAACSRTLTLTHCFDKPYCNIKNNWFSLEPECSGNSYYTQFEYDCQPAFYMCDKEDLIKNAFSGLIYSPSYPNTFRSDRSDPCYLTIKLPKNHHAEITLEYFDLLGTSKCIGDYLEIQQYVDTSDLSKPHGKRSFLTGANKSQIRVKGKQEIKTARQQRRPNYKWHTLGTMCGQIEKSYTIRATANTINFKFRPLPANHPYLASSAKNNQTARNHLGFKIYFQAIPPKDLSSDFDDTTKPIINSPNSNNNKDTTTGLPGMLKTLNTNPIELHNTDNLRQNKSNSSNFAILVVLTSLLYKIANPWS